ncbi:hypothetical protein ACO0QE_002549 [Hanseniaspora vineae]
MGYNGVGLQSAKGSSTSGHVTKALSAQRKNADSHKNYYKRKQLEEKMKNQRSKEEVPEKQDNIKNKNVIEQRNQRKASFVKSSRDENKPQRVLDIHDLLALKEGKQVGNELETKKDEALVQETEQSFRYKQKHDERTVKNKGKTIYDDD